MAIQDAFPGTEYSTLSWIFNAYSIGVASLLLVAGWASDLYGRKRLFLLGMTIFALGSLGAGTAQSINWMIGARAVQSIGGAMLFPSGLALVLAIFPMAKGQMAIGIWAATGGMAGAFGPSVALLIGAVGPRPSGSSAPRPPSSWGEAAADLVPLGVEVGQRRAGQSPGPAAPGRASAVDAVMRKGCVAPGSPSDATRAAPLPHRVGGRGQLLTTRPTPDRTARLSTTSLVGASPTLRVPGPQLRPSRGSPPRRSSSRPRPGGDDVGHPCPARGRARGRPGRGCRRRRRRAVAEALRHQARRGGGARHPRALP